jgi:hypothetical protein
VNAFAVPPRSARRSPWRWLVVLAQAVGFLAEWVDAVVTAWLGVAPVVPRLRRWRLRLVVEWRAYRAVADGSVIDADVIEGELRDGVWH